MRNLLLVVFLISQTFCLAGDVYVFEVAEETSVQASDVPESLYKQVSVFLLVEVLLAIF